MKLTRLIAEFIAVGASATIAEWEEKRAALDSYWEAIQSNLNGVLRNKYLNQIHRVEEEYETGKDKLRFENTDHVVTPIKREE